MRDIPFHINANVLCIKRVKIYSSRNKRLLTCFTHFDWAAQFHIINIQRRMADFHFAKAKTWEEMRVEHDCWVADYNYQVHWAHRHREDNRHSPAEVLGWIRGKQWESEQLDRIFYSTRFTRRLNKAGYLRFRHWRLYGELGLAHRKMNVWLSKEHLTVEFGDEPLSQYAVQYQPDEKHLREIVEPRRFETRFRSPQLDLWRAGEIEWHLVKRLPDYAPRQKKKAPREPLQQLLFSSDASCSVSPSEEYHQG